MRAWLAACAAMLCLSGQAAAQGVTAIGPGAAPAGEKPFYGFEVAWSPSVALEQSRRLTKALDGLAPQRPGVRDVYVLSAGLWGEHVFESEATQAGEQLAKHFHAQGRTIVLSNYQGPGSAGLPAAVPYHIDAALARIGEVMDPKEDIAVVFMTSHGMQNVGIAINETKRLDYRMGPAHLRAALDDAGLKTRVVILSSCFSGQFIPTLGDANTIVLTAASSERPSFGCAPEREWTYFGDALFNTALRQINDGAADGGLISAFERAKTLIYGWETRDRQQPSQPQLHVGVEAAKALAAVEKPR